MILDWCRSKWIPRRNTRTTPTRLNVSVFLGSLGLSCSTWGATRTLFSLGHATLRRVHCMLTMQTKRKLWRKRRGWTCYNERGDAFPASETTTHPSDFRLKGMSDNWGKLQRISCNYFGLLTHHLLLNKSWARLLFCRMKQDTD